MARILILLKEVLIFVVTPKTLYVTNRLYNLNFTKIRCGKKGLL